VADLTFEVGTIEEMENTARVALSGAIDASTVITFQTELDKLKKDGVRRFLLDMAGIRYVNSTGLGSLVKLADGLENEGGMIALMKIHPKVKVVFDMLGLNAFFKIFKTDEEALDFLKESSSETALEPEPDVEVPPGADEPLSPPLEEAVFSPAAEPASPPVTQPETVPVPQPVVIEDAPVAFESPLAVHCQECSLGLRIDRPGDFRCPRCFTVLHVTQNKDVDFRQPNKDIPLQITLNGQVAMVEGLVSCIRTVAQKYGFAGADALGDALGSVCRGITRLAYDGNEKMSFQVLLEASNAELLLRFADSGKPFDIDGADFQDIKNAVSEFSRIPHPRGGNILRILLQA
jgi:stage II sporulation protein AA (anti-sigma F factor antagonist)